MAVTTRVLSLTTNPIDIAAGADVAAEIATQGTIRIALQNTAIGKTAFYADTDTAPAGGSRDGLLLRYGDAVVYELSAGDRLWAWSTTTATLAITEAA